MTSPHIHGFFDPASSTLTYVVWDAVSRDAVVIDPVLDFDPATSSVSQSNLEKLKSFITVKGLHVHWVVDTHVHADHLTGAAILKRAWPGALWGVSHAMNEVFANFSKVFAWPKNIQLSHLGVDRWLRDGEEFSAGTLRLGSIATPGHTPACLCYLIGDAVFTGDTLMMPDGGTGRCDFPGGSAADLYDSVWGKLYALPAATRVFVGHDYQPEGRALRFQSSIGEEKISNIHLKSGTSKPDFIQFRESRDKTLCAPRLLNPSLDWNLGAHQLVKSL